MSPAADPWSQAGARVRFEHGPAGLAALLGDQHGPLAVVVVDVLSFSTAGGFPADVSTALERDGSTTVPVLAGGWFAAA